MMNIKTFNEIEHAYTFLNGDSSIKVLGEGLINDTYLLNNSAKSYVLQRINHLVFPRVSLMVDNIENLTHHLSNDKAYAKKYQSLELLKTSMNKSYFVDSNSNHWRMYNYIDNSCTIDNPNIHQMAVFGEALADLHQSMLALDQSKFTEVIPNFHKLSFRLTQLEEAKNHADSISLELAREELSKIKELAEQQLKLEKHYQNGEIRSQIIHNDCKINNVLFDTKKEKILAFVDLDTVMKGCVHFDIGDVIASLLTKENDKIPTSISLEEKANIDAFIQAYINYNSLIIKELQYLKLASPYMAFIMGVRFITDFLQKNQYYKVDDDTHNLRRAREKLALTELFMDHFQ